MPIPKFEPEGKRMPRKAATPTQKVQGLEIGSKMHRYAEARLLGMTKSQAAKHVGYKGAGPEHNSKVKAYLATQREVMRQRNQISRDDVIQGFKVAIDDAKLLSDPTAQIAGWREIGKMLGHYEPETKRLILTTDQEQQKHQLETMAEDELLRLASDSEADSSDLSIIDADFDFIPAAPRTEH